MSKQRIDKIKETFKVSPAEAKEIDAILTEIRRERNYETLNDGLTIINQILCGYGVEHIMSPEFEPVATYVNKGETYANTILVTVNYYPLIICWGAYAEGKRTL